MPGGQSRWSQGKDLSWEPLRPELVVEVAYEHMQGARFRHMAHFRAMAHGQAAARLHLCAARGGSAAGAGGDFRARPLSVKCSYGRAWRDASLPFAGGIVVGVGCFLRRRRLRHVAEVDADARPGGGAAAHGVDQHIVDGQVAGCFGMLALPALQAGQRGFLVGRVRDDDQRHFGA